MTKRKNSKKYFGALCLSALAIGGGILAVPLMNANDQLAQMQENIKFFEKNPERFLQTENLGLKSGFEDLDKGFADDFVEEANHSMNEGALEAALEAEDYESWREALQNLRGFPEDIGVISEEDFKVLASLHKLKAFEREENENSQ